MTILDQGAYAKPPGISLRTIRIAPSANVTLRRRFWACVFAKAIQHDRQRSGPSLNYTAWLAGMEASEWAAIEAGSVPQTIVQLQSIAGTLEYAMSGC